MLGKHRILSLFPNSFNKFNKTSALMLDSLFLFLLKIYSLSATDGTHDSQPGFAAGHYQLAKKISFEWCYATTAG